MGLQFIFGNATSRKTDFLIEKTIEESIKNSNINYVMIVPEQATLLTQKKIIQKHPKRALSNIDILSFGRLAYRIFEELNLPVFQILDDTGKSMILRKVAAEQKGSLTAFQKNLSKTGFIEELKSMMSEFFQYGIDGNRLKEVKERLEDKPLLKMKLDDLHLIYDDFCRRMQGAYITAEELLPSLCKVINRSSIISNSVLIFDGFTGFTPVQYQLLDLLMIYAKDIIVSVTMDPSLNPYKQAKDHELFRMSHNIVCNLTKMADNNQIKKWNNISITDCGKFHSSITHIETNLFRYPYNVYRKEQEAVKIYQAKNPEEEVKHVLREILHLIREEKYQYKDIAIITGDLASYAPFIDNWFSKVGLPYFLDRKKSLLGNPMVELIRGALEVIEKDFSYESMFRYLRSCLNPIDSFSVDMLENYVTALGIRGYNHWASEWTRTYPGFVEERLEEINATRRTVVQQFDKLREVFKDKESSVRTKTAYLYQFLKEMETENRMKKMAIDFGCAGEYMLQKEYEQAFAKVMDLFDEFVRLMGDDKIPFQTYSDILDAGFENIQVGLIPPTIDRLVIGDLTRTRLGDIKALFVLGVNDGIIPSNNGKGGLLSDMDREKLKEFDLELAPTGKEEGFIQKYYLYLMLTKPMEKLVLSYSRVNAEGKGIRPSYLISTMKKIFPNLREEEEASNPGLWALLQPDSSFDTLLDGLKEFQRGSSRVWWQDLYSWYYTKEEYKPRLMHIVDALFYGYRKEKLSEEVARRLFGASPMNSVTRLERFAGCEYAHFLAYGLGLKPRAEYQLAAMDYGNIFHNSIETFFQLLTEKKLVWETITVEERMDLVKESVSKVTTEYGNTILQSTARNQFLAGRLERMTDKTIWALAEQLKAGGFLAAGSEVYFSAEDNLPQMQFELSEGVYMALQGRIDRVDLAVEDDQVFVKIIDYKTGATSFDLTKIYHGLQLQLIIYLAAAVEMKKREFPNKEVVPAGIYYYNIKDPIVERPEQAEVDAIERASLDEMRMNGLSNSDPAILNLIDHVGKKKSMVVKNLTRDESGMPSSRSMVADTKQMHMLCAYGTDKVANLGREMMKGKLDINPYEYKKGRPCDYCEFKSVCGFDSRLEGYHYRRFSPLKPDEMWEVLNKIYKEDK